MKFVPHIFVRYGKYAAVILLILKIVGRRKRQNARYSARCIDDSLLHIMARALGPCDPHTVPYIQYATPRPAYQVFRTRQEVSLPSVSFDHDASAPVGKRCAKVNSFVTTACHEVPIALFAVPIRSLCFIE